MKLLSKYTNGNYTVEIYSDGTKIKQTDADFFDADFPDSMDIKITDYCDMNCPMCHEQSSELGTHCDFNHPFLNTLHSGTELAIGGGNPLSHPQLIEFLCKMKKQGVICNITLNEQHLLKNIDLVQTLLDRRLVYGLGVSLNEYNDITFKFANKNPNVVFHVILGIVDLQQLQKLYGHNYKILLLGYKKFGRGISFYSPTIDERIKEIDANLYTIFNKFSVVSFDNLALSQLSVKQKVGQQEFERCFMGDDGESTMYVDLVKGEFALSSTSQNRKPITDNILEMFAIVKNMAKSK